MTWNINELPTATRDLAQAIRDVDAYGYCLIEEALQDFTA